MRLTAVIIFLAMAGCATGPDSDLSGRYIKNGGPVRYERLGSVTDTNLGDQTRCLSKQVMWCAGGEESCKCMYVHQAEDRLRRLTSRPDTRRFTNQ